MLAVVPLLPSANTSSSTSTPNQATVLIVVWALEQDPSLGGIGSARRGKKGALPVVSADVTTAEGMADEQDVFVPWELQAPRVKKPRPPPPAKGRPRPPAPESCESPDQMTTVEVPPPNPTPETPPVEKATFNRYYHLFKYLELSNLVRLAARDLGATYISPPTAVSGPPLVLLEPTPAPSTLGEVAVELESLTLEGQRLGDDPDWELVVELKGEVWERENWVVEFGVQWRKRATT